MHDVTSAWILRWFEAKIISIANHLVKTVVFIVAYWDFIFSEHVDGFDNPDSCEKKYCVFCKMRLPLEDPPIAHFVHRVRTGLGNPVKSLIQ